MSRKNIYAIVDTETAGTLDNPLTYDLGLVISDKVGNILYSKMWLIEEIICNKKYMSTAYYKEKLPKYRAMFKKDKKMLVPFKQAKKEFNELLEKYNVNFVCAYNLAFDLRALKYTNYKLDYENGTGWGKCRFITKDYKYLDIWSASCETICQQVNYKKFAKKYNHVSDKGNIRTNAEVVFKYATKKYSFVEDHTALSDALIEMQILAKIFSMKKRYSRNKLISHPWRMVQEKKE